MGNGEQHRRLVLILIVVLTATIRMDAQNRADPFLVGVGVGFGGGIQLGSVPVYAGSLECGTFTSGGLWGPQVGVTFALPEIGGTAFGSSLGLWWRRTEGVMAADPVDGQKVVDPGSSELVTLDRAYLLRTTRDAATLDLLATWMPSSSGSHWTFGVGASVSLPLNFQVTQTDTVKGPGSIAFNDGRRSHLMTGGADLSSALLSFGPVLTAGGRFPLGDKLFVQPSLALHFDAISSVESYGLRDLRGDATVSILFDLSPAPPLPPRKPSLTASIAIEGMNDRGDPVGRAEVTVAEHLQRRYMPLLPALFFSRGDAEVADRYLLNPEVSIDSLPSGADAVELHRYTPAIIADRMAKNPRATLRLYGSVSSDEPPALALRRAEGLRLMLAAKWKVDLSRIIVDKSPGPMKRSGETSEDGRTENRRVVLSSDDPKILAPIVFEERSLVFNPPAIAMHPRIDAEAGVSTWRLMLRQAGKVVATYSSEDTTASDELSWRIQSAPDDTVLSPIQAEFAVVDSVGQKITAYDELPVVVLRHRSVVDRRGEEIGGRSIYTMVAFDYDEATPGREDLELLRNIAERLSDGASVTVTGFTDRIGSEEYNARLSQRRARQVASTLQDFVRQRGVPGVEIRGEGTEQRRFTNDLPEGRIFSRGVQVDVVWR